MRAAAERGLTHLAITDHDRIEGALRGRDAAPDGLTVIVGEEIRTSDGDLVALFLERPVAPHRPARETIAEVREQGGLVGIPHPFDRFRGSMLKDPRLEAMAQLVDWVEAHNARVVGGSGNQRAAEFAREVGLPGVAVSDAHSVLEVGVAYTILDGDPSTPAGLLAALASARDHARPRLVPRADPDAILEGGEPRQGQSPGAPARSRAREHASMSEPRDARRRRPGPSCRWRLVTPSRSRRRLPRPTWPPAVAAELATAARPTRLRKAPSTAPPRPTPRSASR